MQELPNPVMQSLAHASVGGNFSVGARNTLHIRYDDAPPTSENPNSLPLSLSIYSTIAKTSPALKLRMIWGEVFWCTLGLI